MADIDLKDALAMFQNGVQTYQLQSAIGQANDYVQQLKATDLNEQQKRAELQNVSNQLVTHMAALGTPATTIAQVAGAIGPKQYGNSNQMNEDALLTGNSGLHDMAVQQQAFEQNPEYKKQLIMAKAAHALNPLQVAQFNALQDDRATKHFDALDKRVDTQTSRFGGIAKLQNVNNQISDAMTLLQHPEQITPETFPEISRKFDSILSGGVSTVSGSHDLTPTAAKLLLAKSKEFATSKPQAVNMPEWVDYYKNAFGRIQQVNQGIIGGAQKQIIESSSALAHQFPDQFQAYADSRGFAVTIDKKTRKVIAVPKSSGATSDMSGTGVGSNVPTDDWSAFVK